MATRKASTRGSPARIRPLSAAGIAAGLARNPDRGFTLEQLTRAVARLLEICPSAEIFGLSLGNGLTCLTLGCTLEDGAALIGRDSLPRPPRRVLYPDSPWIFKVTRTAGGRVMIRAYVSDDVERCPLAAFTPRAILGLAPEGPGTAREWKELVRSKLEQTLRFSDPDMVEGAITQPVFPRNVPPGNDRKSLQDSIGAVNARFQLRDVDAQHLVALYTRLHGETFSAMMAALDVARVEDRSGKQAAEPLRLVVDNTR